MQYSSLKDFFWQFCSLESLSNALEAIPKTGESQITIRGTTESGGVAAHTL